MRPNAGAGWVELRGLNQWVQLYTGAQIKFEDLTLYLTYALQYLHWICRWEFLLFCTWLSICTLLTLSCPSPSYLSQLMGIPILEYSYWPFLTAQLKSYSPVKADQNATAPKRLAENMNKQRWKCVSPQSRIWLQELWYVPRKGVRWP